MADHRAQSNPRHPGADLWRGTLLQIPTLFGRLVFLSNLRDAHSGGYSHPALLSTDDADRTLRGSHQQVFQEWIGCSLAEQKSDLEDYLSTAGGPRYASAYRDLVPATARDVERQLYLTDLETLLELLRFGNDASFSNPEPSPRR